MVARLIAEVQDLNAGVKQLLDDLPTRTRTWLEPREFARLRGCSTRSLSNWRMQGRFRDISTRKTSRGWQFHGTNAAADLEQAYPLQLGCSTSELARTLIHKGTKQNRLGEIESLA